MPFQTIMIFFCVRGSEFQPVLLLPGSDLCIGILGTLPMLAHPGGAKHNEKEMYNYFFNYGLVIYNSKEPKPQKTNITTNRVKMTFLCTEIALSFSRSHP